MSDINLVYTQSDSILNDTLSVIRPPTANATAGTPVNGGAAKPTGTGTGTKPSGATGSPIVPYNANAASSLQAGWIGTIAMIVGAGIYLFA